MSYKETVKLPKTNFPLNQKVKETEERILSNWKELNLYHLLREKRHREKFILHDGPPYANGNIHIGHALNKILKDTVVRSKQMNGYDAPYIMGWDCHGLPIEWQVEENFLKNGRKKEEISIFELRNECRNHAEKWIGIQKSQFEKLGILTDNNQYYTTMEFQNEARIVREFHKFLLNDYVYRGFKSVFWSTVEETSLAGAEVEYRDIQTKSGYFKFEIEKNNNRFDGFSLLVWTTTPWTLPSNKAVAYNQSIEYVYSTKYKLIFSKNSVEKISKYYPDIDYLPIELSNFENIKVFNPVKEFNTESVPLLPATFVEESTGTGFVHIAPDHGSDDFDLGEQYNLGLYHRVTPKGFFVDSVPYVSGMDIFKSNNFILDIAKSRETLFFIEMISHSYPHSWRSKKPLISIVSPQWYISLDNKNNLRSKSSSYLDRVHWYPEESKNRIKSMVENRPDWCVSRQRSWGVPLAFFVNKETGLPLKDPSVLNKTVRLISEKGCDAWFSEDSKNILGEKYNQEEYEKVLDILDVWFDSGSTHAFVLETNSELHSPADMYLEGSDQHRGWFQSSLIQSIGTRNRAPYLSVLTHGFVNDETNNKMSKSSKNGMTPAEIQEKYGTDVLRLWILTSDYYNDITLSTNRLERCSDILKRFRNTFRYILGFSSEFDTDPMNFDKLPDLEKFILHKLFVLNNNVRALYEEYKFNDAVKELYHFCDYYLSSIYFNIRKDSLYCDGVDSEKRKSCLKVMRIIYNSIIRLLSPVIPFSTDESWNEYSTENIPSVHLVDFLNIPDVMYNTELFEKWEKILEIRKMVNEITEKAKIEKTISTNAEAIIHININMDWFNVISNVDLAEVFLVSKVVFDEPNDKTYFLKNEGIEICLTKTLEEKCERCWNYRESVLFSKNPGLCDRCDNVIG